MATGAQGVYRDQRGRWYFKATVGKDPLTGRRVQITRRGYATAAEAARARREHLAKVDNGALAATPANLTVDDLLDRYLDGLDADERLAAKTRHDYRQYADVYVRPLLGSRKVREITPSVLVAWQRELAEHGGVKSGKPLAPNTVRRARAPLAGAFRMAVSEGLVAVNPMVSTPRPSRRKAVPRHWTPEQAREFLAFQEGDPLYPVWAFLLGSGLRIGEPVALRWENVDLEARVARVVEFVATLGWEVVSSSGKSEDAVRTVDLDDGLVRILREQRKAQAEQRLASGTGGKGDHVFTNSQGRPWHPRNTQYSSKHRVGSPCHDLMITRRLARASRSHRQLALQTVRIGDLGDSERRLDVGTGTSVGRRGS